MSIYLDKINMYKRQNATLKHQQIIENLNKILKEFATCNTVNFSFYKSYYLAQPVIDIHYAQEVAQLLKDDGFKVEEHTIKEYSYEIQYYTATLPETK